MKVTHVELIDRSVKDVWAAFEDPKQILQWQDNLLEFRQIEGKFTQIGGVAEMRVKETGIDTTLTATVLDRDARRREVTYGYEGAPAPFEIANSFRAADGGTEWTAVLDLKLNLLTRALGPVLKPLAAQLVKNNGRNFKAYMEDVS